MGELHGNDVSANDQISHAVPFSPILLEVALVIGVAMLGRWIAGRFRQPTVLGELMIGLVAGNVGYWLGLPFFVMVMHLGDFTPLFSEVWLTGKSVAEAAKDIFPLKEFRSSGNASILVDLMTGNDGPRLVAMGFALWMFSELGVILLLFMVGLETRVDEMLHVGIRALGVAILGVVASFLLGMFVGRLLLPASGMLVHVLVAATLCATSVGITARVLRDLGRVQSFEAKVILGAAVVDDVLGLIILAVVVGVATTGTVDVFKMARISVLSFGFLASVLFFGNHFIRILIPIVTSMEKHHSKLLFPLGLAFFMAWGANTIQLAPIVGAFAAGLILNEEHFANTDQSTTMKALVSPLERLFAPVFFVLIGMQVNVKSLLDPTIFWLALALSAFGIIGKLVSGLLAGKALDRLTIGIGMVPRGEVGLIFASIGKATGIIDSSVFSAIVVMVMVTTFATPLGLKWSLHRNRQTGNLS